MNLPPLPDPIPLPARCGLDAAGELHPLFTAAAAAGGGPVRVDGSEVETVGQAVLQLLIAARRGPGLVLCEPSEALRERLAALALEELA